MAAEAAAAAASGGVPWANFAGMFAMGLGSAVNGTPGMATGTQANKYDNSGWNVNFGNGNIDSARNESQAGSFDSYLPYAVLFVGAMVVWRMTRKKG
jgi:uncharacterized protein with LGFP repeats